MLIDRIRLRLLTLKLNKVRKKYGRFSDKHYKLFCKQIRLHCRIYGSLD